MILDVRLPDVPGTFVCQRIRARAGTQNTLTCRKIAALLVIVAVGLTYGSVSLARSAPQGDGSIIPGPAVFLAAMLPILWSYEETTAAANTAVGSGASRIPERSEPKTRAG